MSRWHISNKDGSFHAYDDPKDAFAHVLEQERAMGKTVTECTEERCWVCFRHRFSPKPPILQPGQIILVTEGMWSDFTNVDLVRVLREHTPEKDRNDWGEGSPLDIDKLVGEGVLERVPYEEWWTG